MHDRLDAEVGTFADAAGYRRYVAGMLAFRAPLEQALAAAPVPGVLGGWRPLAVAEALRRDAQDLAVTVEPFAPLRFSFAEDAAWWAGTLYVLEGSNVGARLLIRRAAALGFGATFGAAHLAVQAADAVRWPRFLALLERPPAIDRERAVAASVATFQHALAAFTKDTHDPV